MREKKGSFFKNPQIIQLYILNSAKIYIYKVKTVKHAERNGYKFKSI